MINTDRFRGKRVAVVGLARSGFSCARLLGAIGSEVNVTDHQDVASTRSYARELEKSGIKVELGRHTKGCIEGRDLVVVSPGVTSANPCARWAEAEGIPVVSEIEVGWLLCPATVIAITGSSGKTTVTTLIGQVIAASGRNAFVCGNIGNPFCQEVERMQEGDLVCLEVSSFQLERIREFKPKIALILNIARNHLDRHTDMREYLEAKKRIFMNQDNDDYLVLNADDPLLKECQIQARSRIVHFSSLGKANPNYEAVTAVAGILGIPEATVQRVFADFKGIEHRMEEVARVSGVTFINDSKATTAESANWALRTISGKVVLIAGGRHKGVDYRIIREEAQKKVKAIILIGEAKDKIAEALTGVAPLYEARTLQEAVERAFALAAGGEYVLLSPMCSSFDMFSSYEERGREFKRLVGELPDKEKRIGAGTL